MFSTSTIENQYEYQIPGKEPGTELEIQSHWLTEIKIRNIAREN